MQHEIRLRALCILTVLALGSTARAAAAAADDLAVLPPEPPPRKMLYSFLLREAKGRFDERRDEVARLNRPEDIGRRREALRGKFVSSLGGFPPRTPLNARVVGVERREGFRVEKVIYESRPDHHVTALAYVPDGPGPFPGILMPCGHDRAGKADESLQRAGILYARNGFVVVCYDPIGQGERRQLIEADGKPVIQSMTTEHTVLGIAAMLVGRQTANYRVWDGIRSLDYLCARPDVDPKRIGCTGSSGGGMMTSYLMALDDRVVAAAPSCYVTSLERLFATIGPQDAEQNITGQVAFGMEQSDYLNMHAPKPALICSATQDFFDIGGTWVSFREAKRTYGILGRPECVDIVEFEGKHGYPKAQREAVVRFMRRWLMGTVDAPVEADVEPFTTAQLQCTKAGQVLLEFKDKSVVDLNAAREAELAAERKALRAKLGPDAWLTEVRAVAGVPEQVGPAKMAEAGRVARDGYAIRKLTFETDAGIVVPGLMFEAKPPVAGSPLVIYLNGDGMAADAQAGGPIEALVKGGARVLAIDPRGVGETSPGKPSAGGVLGYLSSDYNEAYLSIHLARPLLGQRTYDVLRVLAAMPGEKAVRIVGVGSMGPVALHAAAFETRVSQVTVRRSLASWASVVRSPVSRNQLTNVVPGALRVYDLPDLADAIAPRNVVVESAVDANNVPVPARVP